MTKTPLWEIALPARTNEGADYSAAHRTFNTITLQIVGGATQRPTGIGVWKDAGKVYMDEMVPYRVACSEEQFAALVDHAFRLFPDQVAIFTSRIGEAEIITRQEFNARIVRAWIHGGPKC